MARLSISYFVVNAFAEKPFAGNPAGICVLDRWLPAAAMQAIAAENGLPVTAFLVGVEGSYAMRWFTPVVEEEMCGHATLGASWVVLNRLVPGLERVVFATTAGALEVTRSINIYTLDLPAQPPTVCTAPDMLVAALGAPPREVLRAAYYIAVFDNAGEIAALQPDFAAIAALDTPGLIATAPGVDIGCDIATRYFAPAKGIPEDAATGSAHAQIVPYWSRRLGRTVLEARQLSPRGGRMRREDRGAMIRLSAPAALYLSGSIEYDA